MTKKATKEDTSAYQKLGQERWDAIRLLKGVCSELTADNDLEDTIVFLCYEVVKRDKPFQEISEKISDLNSCPNCKEPTDD